MYVKDDFEANFLVNSTFIIGPSVDFLFFMGLLLLDHVVVRPMIDSSLCPSLVYGQPFRSGKSHDPAWSEVARPFAVYHMESNTSLFMASPDDTTVQRD